MKQALTKTQKAEFMRAQGIVFAGHGAGLFSYYKGNPRTAYAVCLSHKPLGELVKDFGEEEFTAFEEGFNSYLAQLKEMQAVKMAAQAEVRRLLVLSEGEKKNITHWTQLESMQGNV